MEINDEWFEKNCYSEIQRALFKHFQYSIKDIDSYDELTKEEKEIFPKDIFENLIIKK